MARAKLIIDSIRTAINMILLNFAQAMHRRAKGATWNMCTEYAVFKGMRACGGHPLQQIAWSTLLTNPNRLPTTSAPSHVFGACCFP